MVLKQGISHAILIKDDGTLIDVIGKSISVMLHNEVDVHNGFVWRAFWRASVASSGSISFLFKAASLIDAETLVSNWLVLNAFSAGALRIELYKDANITSPGTLVVTQNSVLDITSSPVAQLYRDPTLVSDGTKIDEIPAGASKESALVPDIEEWAIPGSIMHIKIINLDNGTQDITSRFRISEHA